MGLQKCVPFWYIARPFVGWYHSYLQ
jgi:hypothetical protein